MKSYEDVYDAHRSAVQAALMAADDRTTMKQARYLAHEAAFAAMEATAKAVRNLDKVTLESVLLILGERP